MKVISSIPETRAALRELPRPHGLVPTMGYLHEGHLELVRRARAENDCAAASIFVNPAQFGPREDLSRYPRDPERDLALLRREGVVLVFMPEPDEVYPPGFDTWVDPGIISGRLEGKSRPGHFRGVATVLRVIQRMVRDLNLPLEIVPAPTVRDPDGLALSSRNVYLSAEQRRQALALSASLRLARELVAGGEHRVRAIKSRMRRLIQREPEAAIDYISIADSSTLAELTTIDRPALISLAVRIGATRLIDNTVVLP